MAYSERSPRVLQWNLVTASLAVLLSSCSEHGPDVVQLGNRVHVVDSAGIEIVMSEPPDVTLIIGPQAGIGPTVRIAPTGTASNVLDHVRAAARLSDGRIVVLNGRQPTVLLFDRAGSFVRSIGALGGGPGEYRDPNVLRVSLADTIGVWESQFGPHMSFDTTGQVLSTEYFDLEQIRDLLGPTRISERHLPIPGVGLLVATTESREGSEQLGAVDQFERFIRLDTAYSGVEFGRYLGLVSYNANWKGRTIRLPPLLLLGAHAAVTHDGTGGYFASSNGDEIQFRDVNGQLARIIRPLGPAARISPDDLTAMKERWRRQTDARFGPGAGNKLLRKVPSGEAYPRVLDLVVGRSGQLWVRTSISDWSEFDTRGHWVASYRLPYRRLLEVGERYVLGLEVDEDDVESVTEYAR